MMRISKIVPRLLILVFTTLACSLPVNSLNPQVATLEATTAPGSDNTPVIAESETPAPSPTSAPTTTETLTATLAPSPTSGPQCTILKTVNFRNGPGTAYYNLLGSFSPGTVLTPSGYNPVGSPNGAWVQVTNPANNQVGWISADVEFVECTIDLRTLPSVTVKPPPPPQVPMVSNLPAQGPQGGDIDFAVVMSPDYLMRIKAHKHGSKNDGDGIDHVVFIVANKNNEIVYSSTEKTAKYCIFMGGEPNCNLWPKSNGHFVWGSSGSEITSGNYQVTIRVALKDNPTNESEWSFRITIKLP